jgi:hypothetical protein
MSVTHDEIKDAFNAFQKAYNNKITIKHIPFNEPKDIYHDRITAEDNRKTSGAYHPSRGLILTFAANLHDYDGIVSTLAHEIGGHWSLNALSSAEKRSLLENISQNREEPSLIETWEKVEKLYPHLSKLHQAEEVFSFVAEETLFLSKHQDIQLNLETLNTNFKADYQSLSTIVDRLFHDISDGERKQQIFPTDDITQFKNEDIMAIDPATAATAATTIIDNDIWEKELRKQRDFPLHSEAEARQAVQDLDSLEAQHNITSRHMKLDDDIAHGFTPDADEFRSIAEKDAVDFHKIYPQDSDFAKTMIDETKARSADYETAFKKTLFAEQSKPQEFNQRREADKIASAAPSEIAAIRAKADADLLEKRRASEATQAALAANSIDVTRTGKELGANEFIMPIGIKKSYDEVNGNFYAKNSERVMFSDKGHELTTSTTEKKAIADMVILAKAKQWESIKLSGTQEFRREAWLQAESQGIKTSGYTPKEHDLAALKTLTNERSTNTITPVNGNTAQKFAPRTANMQTEATTHDIATKNIAANALILKDKPAYADMSQENLNKVAYWRGIVMEDIKLEPEKNQEETLAKFDARMSDPQALKKINDATEATIEDKTVDQVKVQSREEEGMSL